MNITLFGGAFNPPHIGHLIVIQQALELIPTEELWLLPDNVASSGKNLAPAHHRIHMVKLLQEEMPPDVKSKISLNTTLIDEDLTGYTYEYLQVLKKKYPQHNFSFLMGSDNLVNFEKWGNWEKLIEDIHFYIYPRNGYQAKNIYKNMTLLKSDTQVITNFSSTIMRKRAHKNLSLKNFLPKSILDYIKENRLY